MSRPTLVVIECAILFGLGVSLMGNTNPCAGPVTPSTVESGPTLVESPEYEGRQQVFDITADADKDDGSPGSSVGGSVVPGPDNPFVVSKIGSGDVTTELILETDADTFQADCIHVPTGPSETSCIATLRVAFPISNARGNAVFDVQLVDLADESSNLSDLTATVVIGCGGAEETAALEGAQTSVGTPQQMRLEVAVSTTATECSVVASFDSSLIAIVPTPPSGVENLHSVRVNAVYEDPIECADNSQCPSTLPHCGPQSGQCQAGGTAQDCAIAALHCDTDTHPWCTGKNSFGFNGCSNGIQSPCDWDGQCAGGHECSLGFCKPLPGTGCGTDAECAADESCVTGGSCVPKPMGEPGQGCWDGFGCKPADSSGTGVCQGQICQVFGSVGDPCGVPGYQCDYGTYCEGTSGTCQDQLPLGSDCGLQNDACLGFPGSASCTGGAGGGMGTCKPTGGSGAVCEERVDCELGRDCVGGFCS